MKYNHIHKSGVNVWVADCDASVSNVYEYKGKTPEFITGRGGTDFDPAIEYYNEQHTNWADGTNSKFKDIISLSNCKSDYLYYFDADTNINQDFTEEWFIGDLVGGEHYGNRNFLSGGKGFDRHPLSKAYVPEDSPLPYTYHYGAFFWW